MKIARTVAALALLASCSALEPYPVQPRAAPTGAVDAGPRVAIC